MWPLYHIKRKFNDNSICKQYSLRRFLCHQAIERWDPRSPIRMYLWSDFTKSSCPSFCPCSYLSCCPSYGPSSCLGIPSGVWRGDRQSPERHHYYYPLLHHRNHHSWLPGIKMISLMHVMVYRSIIPACQNIPRVGLERGKVHRSSPCGGCKRCQKLYGLRLHSGHKQERTD